MCIGLSFGNYVYKWTSFVKHGTQTRGGKSMDFSNVVTI